MMPLFFIREYEARWVIQIKLKELDNIDICHPCFAVYSKEGTVAAGRGSSSKQAHAATGLWL